MEDHCIKGFPHATLVTENPWREPCGDLMRQDGTTVNIDSGTRDKLIFQKEQHG